MATYIAVIMLTLALLTIYILGVLNENLYDDKRVGLFAKANIISDTLTSSLLDEDIKTIQNDVGQLLAGTGIRGIVLNTAFNVIYDTNGELTGKVLMRDIIKTAADGEQAHFVMQNDSGINMMTVAVPMKSGERIVGAIYLIESLEGIDSTVRSVRINLLVFSFLIALLVGMLSLGMSFIVTSPLDDAMNAAKEISKGNFDVRVRVRGHNEFAQLAATINYMCTELQNLDNNRKKFVSDASHELKTPLATIKLICDSIVTTDNPDPEMIKDFLGDLSVEVDRLTRIIERLLMLTKMDSQKAGPRLAPTDFIMLLNAIVKKLTPNANAKSIVLYTEFKTEDISPFLLDYDKIWEAVYNICDNAIKYTPEGGFVKLELEKEGKSIVLMVEDNGIGISPEEKERIFERFYRPDDSRARETGGTGLGLSIARESVLMHGGTIEVISEVGLGSTFKITLPYNTSV